jgi:hypothetical protein
MGIFPTYLLFPLHFCLLLMFDIIIFEAAKPHSYPPLRNSESSTILLIPSYSCRSGRVYKVAILALADLILLQASSKFYEKQFQPSNLRIRTRRSLLGNLETGTSFLPSQLLNFKNLKDVLDHFPRSVWYHLSNYYINRIRKCSYFSSLHSTANRVYRMNRP